MHRSTAAGPLLAVLLAACATTGVPASSGTAVPTASPRPQPTTTAVPRATDTRSPSQEPALGEAPVGETERARVVRVTDGDTIVIDRGRGEERLRYIGVDTPESVKPDSPVEFMAREASAANRALVEGRDVILERDITEYDRFDRLLRYVWVEDDGAASGLLLVNLALVARGYAQVVTYPPDIRYVDLYLEAQRAAREQGLGLWAGEASDAAPSDFAGGSGRADCEPAYPGVCIPPAPPDLDCGDVTFRRFEVLPPDPHRFDLDFDGVGCEGG